MLSGGESPLSSLQKATGLEDCQMLPEEANRRTGVLQFRLLPVRRTRSLESEHGWDLGLFVFEEHDEKTESMKTSGVNSSILTDLLMPDLTVKMTPFIVGSDFVALFSGLSGFLGVILPEGDV